MKNYLTLLILFPLFSFGQKTKVSWGSPFLDKSNPHFEYKFIDSDNEGHYFLSQSTETILSNFNCFYRLLKVDDRNEVISNDVSNLFSSDKKIKFLRPIRIGDKTYAIGSKIKFSDKGYRLYASEFLNGEFQTEKEIFNHYFKRGSDHVVTSLHKIQEVESVTQLSADNSKMVFANQQQMYDSKKKNDKISIAVFDENLNVLWSKTQDFDYVDSKFMVNKVVVSNNGEDVFLIGALNKVKKKALYDFKVFHITKSSVNEYTINTTEGREILSISPSYNNENKVLNFSGFYSKKKDRKVNGIFTGEFDFKMKKVKEITFEPFTEKEKKAIYFRRVDNKNTLNIFNSRRLSNGNIQVIAEHSNIKFKHFKPHYYGYEWQTEKEFPMSNGVIVIYTLSENGKLLNKKIVNKDWRLDGMQKPFLILEGNDNTFVIYKTKLTNEDRDKYKLKGRIYPVTKIIKIKPDGKVEKPKLLFYPKTTKFDYFKFDGLVFGNKIIFGGQFYYTKVSAGFAHKAPGDIYGSFDLDFFD